MPRGKRLKTKIKEARELAKARAIGVAKGEIARLKLRVKNVGLLLQEKLAEMEIDDLAKYTAIIGATIMIKNGIDWTQTTYEEEAQSWFINIFAGGLYSIMPNLILKAGFTEDDVKPRLEGLAPEMLEWVISFGLAYVIITNFGEIVTAAGTALSSITSIAKLLLVSGAA